MLVDTEGVEHLTDDSMNEAARDGADSPSYVSDPKVTDRGIEVYIDNKGVIPDSMAATLREVSQKGPPGRWIRGANQCGNRSRVVEA